MEKRRALLIGDFGDSYLYAYETSHLLKRAGFDVDLVTNNPISGKLRSIGNYTCVDKVDEISRAALVQAERAAYELIVVLDDLTLTEIRNSNLSNDEKLILLPVQTEEGLQHIGSKNGLNLVLKIKGSILRMALPAFLSVSLNFSRIIAVNGGFIGTPSSA